MAREEKRAEDMVAEILWLNGQAETTNAVEKGTQAETTQTDTAGTSSSPPLV